MPLVFDEEKTPEITSLLIGLMIDSRLLGNVKTCCLQAPGTSTSLKCYFRQRNVEKRCWDTFCSCVPTLGPNHTFIG